MLKHENDLYLLDDDDDDDDLGFEDGIIEGEDGIHYKMVEIKEQDRFLPIANIARWNFILMLYGCSV
jgi:hypothetical protein